MQVGEQTLDNTRTGIALADELAYAGQAHGYQGKLSRGKEAVECDKREDADQAYSKHG